MITRLLRFPAMAVFSMLFAATAQGTVTFIEFEDDISFAQASASVPGSQCLNTSPAFGPNELSVGDSQGCTAGAAPVTARASGTFSGDFTGAVDDVDSITVSASGESEGSAPGFSSRSGIGSGAVTATFSVTGQVEFHLSLQIAAADTAFRFGVSTRASASGPANFIETSAPGGQPSQTLEIDGVLQPGTYSISAGASADSSADFVQDIASASASATISFQPVRGGCCIDGSCSLQTLEDCGQQGGSFLGANEPCAPCPQPEGEGEEECDIAWSNGDGGEWIDADNWEGGNVPADDGEGCNNAVLGLDGLYTVDFAGLPQTANSLLIRNGALTLTGGLLTLSGRTSPGSQVNPQPALGVGRGGIGKLSGGTILATRATIGDLAGTETDSIFTLQDGSALTIAGALDVGRAEGATLNVFGGVLTSGSGNIGAGQGIGLSTVNVSNGAQWLSGALNIAEKSNGRLEIDEGGVVISAASKVGNAPSRVGEANIDGADSRWTVNGALTIGSLGAGNVNLSNGAALSATDAIVDDIGGEGAALRVTGEAGATPSRATFSGSLNAGLASEQTAIIELRKGGQLKVGGDATLGHSEETTLTIAENGSGERRALLEVAGKLTIGQEAAGKATLNNGSKVTAEELVVGDNASFSGLTAIAADDDPSALRPVIDIAGEASIGVRDDAFVDLFDGAEFSVGRLTLGVEATGVGELLLLGSDADDFPTALTSDGPVTIGDLGHGELTVEQGASVTAFDQVNVGTFTGAGTSRGDLTIRTTSTSLSSRLSADGEIRIGGDAAFVKVLGESTLRTKQILRIGTNANLSMTQDATVTATLIDNAGIMQLVTGSGNKQAGEPVRIEGNYTQQAGGKLVVLVEDAGAPALVITGNATLAGILEVRFADGVALSAGQQLTLLDVGGTTTGAFASTTFPTRNAEFQGSFSTDNGNLVLTVVNPGGPAGGNEGEDEGDGEGDGGPASGGCNCGGGDKGLSVTDYFGNWLLALFSAAVLLGAGFRKQAAAY